MLARSLLQDWARQVPGSLVGETTGGTLLLLVPASSQAQDTRQALCAVLDRAVQAFGLGSAGGWALKVIGPLRPGTPAEVAQHLAQAGWPVS